MSKGEWREPADLNSSRLGLVLALLAAAMLRFWALPQGMPCCPGADEPEVMERAVRMMKTGSFNPGFFDYPSLYMYVQAAVAVCRFMMGAMRGLWHGLAQAPTEEFYVWGRAVTAIVGTATVWIVYRAGMRWGSRTTVRPLRWPMSCGDTRKKHEPTRLRLRSSKRVGSRCGMM